MARDLIDIQFDFDALTQALGTVSGFSDRLERELEKGLLELATLIEGEAKSKLKQHGSIDQGQLWNSIAVVPVSSEQVLVGTNVSYAAAVEYGTKGHWLHIESTPGFRNWLKRHGIDNYETLEFFYVEPKPKPYMEPAFEEGKSKAPKIIEGLIQTAMKKSGAV